MAKISKKSENVEAMFNGIASKYDLLNHLLSFGIDKSWRRRLVRQLGRQKPDKVLDVATGTADLAIQLAYRLPSVSIIGIDISEKMLRIGRSKVEKRGISSVRLVQANSMEIPFGDGEFDAVMVAFGVRNFEDLPKGLSEIYRVLKTGGCLYVLEFSIPDKFPVANVFRFYFRRILPWFGRIVSGSYDAYTYLPESVATFPEKENFLGIMAHAGFRDCSYQRVTFGIASIYVGFKI